LANSGLFASQPTATTAIAANVFGLKAEGLASIPTEWRPAEILLSASLYDQWLGDRTYLQNLPSVALEAFIAEAAITLGRSWLVRSSATNETVEDRGQNLTLPFSPDDGPAGLRTTIETIFQGYQPAGGGRMALVINRQIDAVQKGHLSNDLRVVDKPYRWYIEAHTSDGTQMLAETISAKQGKALSAGSPLVCTSASELKSRARAVALHFWRNEAARLLLEWVWDGTRLWVVQLDRFKRDTVGFNPAASPISAFVVPAAEEGVVFKRYTPGTDSRWGKLKRLSEFRSRGKPPPHRLFWATASALRHAIEQNGEALAREIQSLTGGRAVLRTDGIGGGFNRARTDTVTPEEALDWIGSLIEKMPLGSPSDDYVFILHAFIPARAAAWSHFALKGTLVRIEGLWGLADGMQYNSTDIYWYDVAASKEISRQVRYKSHVMIEQADGSWTKEEVAPAYARYSSLSKQQIEDIGARTAEIAANCGTDVQIMWFVDIDPSAGLGENLPWFRIVPEEEIVEPARSPITKSVTVTSIEDLGKLVAVAPGSVKIILNPSVPDVRSEEFIAEVARRCAELNLPVELRGGILSHAYHQLRKSGVEVYSAEPGKPPQELTNRKKFHKVVRDDIPRFIASRGEVVSSDTLSIHERTRALVGKLIEEAGEFVDAKRGVDKREELADLYEVFRALSTSVGASMGDILAVANAKREKRGGFDEGVVLRETRHRSTEDNGLFETPSQGRKDRSLAELLTLVVKGDTVRAPVSLLLGRPDAERVTLTLDDGRLLELKMGVVAGDVVVKARLITDKDDQPKLL